MLAIIWSMVTTLQETFLNVMGPFRDIMNEHPPTTPLGKYVLGKLGVPLSQLNTAITDSEERREEACAGLRAIIDPKAFEQARTPATVDDPFAPMEQRRMFNNLTAILSPIIDKLDPKAQ